MQESEKSLFIIGDIHGCLHTLKSLLQYWYPEKEQLIQLGDMIDRGNYSQEVVAFLRKTQETHKDTIILKGNHEWLSLEHFDHGRSEWYPRYGKKVLWEYHLNEVDFQKDLDWFRQLPLFWENDHIFVSHAGISHSPEAMNENHREGLLWTRSNLKHIGKVQVIGHTPVKGGKPVFTEESNSWNIDTGVYMGKKLSALRMKQDGTVLEILSVHTEDKDIE